MLGKKDAEFIKQCKDAHDYARKPLGVPSLEWDEDLAKEAQEWANTMLKEKNMHHSKKKGMGENIAWEYNSNKKPKNVHDMIIRRWIDNEKPYFEYKTYPCKDKDCKKEVGHYTQVIWKNTKKFGVGLAEDGEGNAYLCANYQPAGNFIGQFPY